MKQILSAVLAAALSLLLAACGTAEGDTTKPEAGGDLSPTQQQEQTSLPDHPTTSEENVPETPATDGTAITISVGGQTFSATLLKNESARQLAGMFPLTLDVSETPVVTNFYLAEGSKQGIGTQQSHERYDILNQVLADHADMTMEDVRDALDSVSKHNFNEFESTEWSAVFNLSTGEAHYYHWENYENRFTFSIGSGGTP